MSWKVRNQGSPRHVELSLNQVVEGLQDGVWDATAEVMGPRDKRWVPIDSHPVFADAVYELEEAAQWEGKEPEDPEEQRIDMNPLIDVCLVLLVFFILATTMAILEKVLDMPEAKQEVEGPIKIVKEEEVDKFMIKVTARKENNRNVIRVETAEVEESQLQRHLRRFVSDSKKNEMLIDAQGVEWGTIVTIIDAAGGAGIKKISFKTGTAPPKS
jgi:biopolymer transport protein ExbD